MQPVGSGFFLSEKCIKDLPLLCAQPLPPSPVCGCTRVCQPGRPPTVTGVSVLPGLDDDDTLNVSFHFTWVFAREGYAAQPQGSSGWIGVWGSWKRL